VVPQRGYHTCELPLLKKPRAPAPTEGTEAPANQSSVAEEELRELITEWLVKEEVDRSLQAIANRPVQGKEAQLASLFAIGGEFDSILLDGFPEMGTPIQDLTLGYRTLRAG
jgi:hypothetical protein